jgi:hypothetical protein
MFTHAILLLLLLLLLLLSEKVARACSAAVDATTGCAGTALRTSSTKSQTRLSVVQHTEQSAAAAAAKRVSALQLSDDDVH